MFTGFPKTVGKIKHKPRPGQRQCTECKEWVLESQMAKGNNKHYCKKCQSANALKSYYARKAKRGD